MYGWSRECNLCGYQHVQTCTNIHNVYMHVDPKKKTKFITNATTLTLATLNSDSTIY